MNDFFGALELELRAAAERRPRRTIGLGVGLSALAAAALLAAAVLVVGVTGGGDSARVAGGPQLDPVGTVIPKGGGQPPRGQRSTVVATGTVRFAGTWQLESQPSELLKDDRGEVMQPAGLRCLWLYLLDPPRMRGGTGAGFCGPFPRTPGFSRGQMNVPIPGRTADGRRVHPSLVLLYGRVPERAEYINVTVRNGLQLRGPVHDGPNGIRGDYYLFAVPPGIGRSARINWLDKDREPGSRGIALLPPVTR
jgi:hypothetical protein